jgi:hypothetical protein
MYGTAPKTVVYKDTAGLDYPWFVEIPGVNDCFSFADHRTALDFALEQWQSFVFPGMDKEL